MARRTHFAWLIAWGFGATLLGVGCAESAPLVGEARCADGGPCPLGTTCNPTTHSCDLVAPGPDGGGDGSDGDAGDGLALGCRTYAEAWCGKTSACLPTTAKIMFGQNTECVERIDVVCRISQTAPGVSADAAGLATCASAIGKASCSDFLDGGAIPSCTWTGTLPHGASCMYDQQCQGGVCQGDGACGICGVLVAAGQACTAADACAPGLTCMSGKCQPKKSLGALCNYSADCAATLICTAGECREPLPVGAACMESTDCSDGAVCLSTCQPLVVALPGDGCNLSQLSAPIACGGGGSCVSGTCSVPALDGEPCNDSIGPRCRPYAQCRQGRCQLPNPQACQ